MSMCVQLILFKLRSVVVSCLNCMVPFASLSIGPYISFTGPQVAIIGLELERLMGLCC